MRNADLATLVRVLLVFFVVYLVIIKFNPIVSVLLFALALILDAADGYLAVSEASNGKIGISEYIKSAMGDSEFKKMVKEAKLKAAITAPYGPRLDIVGDRITELSFWAIFLYLHIISLFVVLIIIVRHTLADGFMGMKGTSSKTKTTFARIFYSSNASRAAANILKFTTFSYLIFEFVSGYPAWIGNILVGVLVAFIVIRGASELYESFSGGKKE